MKTARTYEELKSRLDELSGNTVEKQTNNTAEAKKKAEAYNTAFWETMHTGMPQNALKEGSDGSGGYLVPDTYDDRLVQALKRKNVLRQIATIVPTTQKLTIPVSLGGENASWMPENEPYRFCEAEFGEIEIDAYKLGSSILVSDELLEDCGVDLEKYIEEAFAYRIGNAEESAFIHGDGNGKPIGLIHQASVGKVTDEKGKISADDLVDMEFSLAEPYRKNAVWVMSNDAYCRLGQLRHYRMFVEGMSAGSIAKHLTESGVPTPSGKTVWQRHTIESILQNEKYKGSALLQKKYTVDFLQKKMKVNEGEVPQYYVEHSHPAIIAPEEWERVQLELKRRKDSGRRTFSTSPFAGKLICGDCREIFGSKVWHSNSKYRRTIWQCNAKFKGDTICTTPHLYEDDIKELFVVALSKLLVDREALLEDGRLIRHELMDTAAIDTECEELLQEMDVVAGLIQKWINENAVNAIDQDEYISRYNSLVERHEKAQNRYDTLQKKRGRRLIQADVMSGFLFAITELDTLQLQFNPPLWHTTVDHVTVYADERLVFHFKNGSEVEVQI